MAAASSQFWTSRASRPCRCCRRRRRGRPPPFPPWLLPRRRPAVARTSAGTPATVAEKLQEEREEASPGAGGGSSGRAEMLVTSKNCDEAAAMFDSPENETDIVVKEDITSKLDELVLNKTTGSASSIRTECSPSDASLADGTCSPQSSSSSSSPTDVSPSLIAGPVVDLLLRAP